MTTAIDITFDDRLSVAHCRRAHQVCVRTTGDVVAGRRAGRVHQSVHLSTVIDSADPAIPIFDPPKTHEWGIFESVAHPQSSHMVGMTSLVFQLWNQ